MTLHRTAWLYTRNDESVRLELVTTAAGVQLTIDGPGAARASYDFPPGTTVDAFRQDYEQRLMADGYRLQAVAERRRDGASRTGGGERRRRDR
jgi:hypothetical protein